MNYWRIFTAVILLAAATSFAGAGKTPERFLVYQVERIAPEPAPVIDGKLDEAAWQGKATISTLRNLLGPLLADGVAKNNRAMDEIHWKAKISSLALPQPMISHEKRGG